MVKYFNYLFLALLILNMKIAAQGTDKIIAKAGDKKISEREKHLVS